MPSSLLCSSLSPFCDFPDFYSLCFSTSSPTHHQINESSLSKRYVELVKLVQSFIGNSFVRCQVNLLRLSKVKRLHLMITSSISMFPSQIPVMQVALNLDMAGVESFVTERLGKEVRKLLFPDESTCIYVIMV